MHPTASPFVAFAFLAVSLVVTVFVAWGVHRALRPGPVGWLVFAAWLGVPQVLAFSGVLARFDARPPPLMPVVLGFTVVTFVCAARFGAKVLEAVPVAAIVGLQAFRLPLELVMHAAAGEGTMPPQMSYSGWNFDIVTGVLAIPVAVLLARGSAPRWLLAGWNVLGLALLVNVVSIGIASLPVFAAFGPDRMNTWLSYAPFTWLPTQLVQVALAGHLLVFRSLRATSARTVGAV